MESPLPHYFFARLFKKYTELSRALSIYFDRESAFLAFYGIIHTCSQIFKPEQHVIILDFQQMPSLNNLTHFLKQWHLLFIHDTFLSFSFCANSIPQKRHIMFSLYFVFDAPRIIPQQLHCKRVIYSPF